MRKKWSNRKQEVAEIISAVHLSQGKKEKEINNPQVRRSQRIISTLFCTYVIEHAAQWTRRLLKAAIVKHDWRDSCNEQVA